MRLIQLDTAKRSFTPVFPLYSGPELCLV